MEQCFEDIDYDNRHRSVYDMRWKYAMLLVNRHNNLINKLKTKPIVLYDEEVVNNPQIEIEEDCEGIKFILLDGSYIIGDNDPTMDNGVMHNSLKEIKESFDRIKIYQELNI